MKLAELTKKINFFVSGVIIAGMFMFGVLLIQLGLMSPETRMSIVFYGSDLSYIISTYGYQVLLTVAFSVALMYAILGAIIAGSVTRDKLHPCFTCLFSLAVPATMIGLGAAWFGHLSLSVSLLYGTVAFLTITSYCAQHAKDIWPHFSEEHQTSGNEF